MIRTTLLCIVLCSAARADDVTLTVSGRPFVAHLPKSAGKKPAPLLLLLHPYSGEPDWMPRQLDVRRDSDERGYYLAVPSGTLQPDGRVRFWNATGACCDFLGSGVDDVGYLRAVIQTMRDHYPIDPRRIYVFGFSNGGFMAHRLACELPQLIAGIVSVSGAGPERCAADSPVTILEIHGTADDVVPLAGGKLGGGLPTRVPFPSVNKTMEEWARRDGCKPPQTMEPLDLDPRIPGAETRVDRWSGCRGGALVEQWTTAHGAHIPWFSPQLFQRAFNLLSQHPRQ